MSAESGLAEPQSWDGVTERRQSPRDGEATAEQIARTLGRILKEVAFSENDGMRAKLEAQLARLGASPDSQPAQVQPTSDEAPASAANPAGIEAAPETLSRLQAYSEQYSKLNPEIRGRCNWVDIKIRLLEHNGAQLERAKGLNGEGILFGIDRNGKALFADRALDPRDLPHCGLNYEDTCEAVMFEMKGDKKVETGYRMFPIGMNYKRSEEVLMFEAATGNPFVKSKNGRELVSSWLEGGMAVRWPRGAPFSPGDGCAFIPADISNGYPDRGVRRLLRV